MQKHCILQLTALMIANALTNCGR